MDASSPSAVRGRTPSDTAQVIHLQRARPRIPRPRRPIVRVVISPVDSFLVGLVVGLLAAGSLAVIFIRAGVGS